MDYKAAISYNSPVKTITYSREASKTLAKMPVNTARRIVQKVEAYATNPASQANNATALKGRDGLRLRVGNWRVIMKDGVVIYVVEIGSRGSIYE